mgnify:CR=1 FL=1
MAQFQIDDLLHLMSRLRDPSGGCPWDIKQTYNTIVPCTLEEAYEVADAIERKDFAHLQEELGDLLFQVIFYAQLGLEDGHFKFADVVDSLVTKLVRRHPHVFPDGDLYQLSNISPLNDEQIKGRWEAIKELERQAKGKAQAVTSILDDVPRALPAIQRAEKLQKRAALVGFDWPEANQVLDKIEEEIGELREAMLENDHAHIQDELGDVMFAMVNLARHLNVKPEMAIRSTNEKFERRFKYVESSLNEQGIALQDANLEQMELLWLAAKKLES